jgi:HEAT repeat protein
MKEKLIVCVGLVVLVAVAAACWYWGAYGAWAARLAESDDRDQRLRAIRELRGKHSALAVDVFRRLSGDPDETVAVQAVQALGDAGTEQCRGILQEILQQHQRGKLRGEAAAALGLYPQTDPHLLGERLLNDPDGDARIGAAKGLARLRRREGVKYLVAALERDRDPRMPRVAIVALRRILIVEFFYQPDADPATRKHQLDAIKQSLRNAKLL